jgi:hypothetical protein
MTERKTERPNVVSALPKFRQTAPSNTTPKRVGKSSSSHRSKRGISKPKQTYEAAMDRLAEQYWGERQAWLQKPRLHTAIFEEAWQDQEAIEEGSAVFRSYDPQQKIEKVAKQIGWSNHRLDIFTQLVTAYRQNPTIENYVRVRRLFPEVGIQVAEFGGIEPLFALEDDLKKVGVAPDLVAAALDANEPSIDALCLRLLQCLITRENLPKDGPGFIQKRRRAISDSTVNYLIVAMLESYDWHEETFRVPASLIVLIRHQLCGTSPDLHKEFLSRERRQNVAISVGQRLKPGEKLSINKLRNWTDIPRSTAARWLNDDDFLKWLEFGRRVAADALFKLFPYVPKEGA